MPASPSKRKKTGPSAKARNSTRDDRTTPMDSDETHVPPLLEPAANQAPLRPADNILTDEENIDPQLRGLRADGTRQTMSSETPEGNASTLVETPINEVTPTMQQLGRTSGDDSSWEDEDDDDDEDKDEANRGTKGKGDAESDGEGGGGAHGYIEGVMRGNHEFWLKRTTALRPPSMNSAHASKRFHRVIRQILTKIENLAVETGCWIYLAAQHATAVTPFIHYASPRLIAEAGPELDVIHTNFSIIMKTLVMSRRRQVMELTLELEEKREELDQAKKAAEAARVEADARREESSRKDAVIASLMARLAA
ncbi:hypothetical protein NP233_g11976 [Leucocoprinus birnbaumii]|uniref:Uncharacterized protein n=1 Tax=Leucocoprinus birnbaumii TaxID=56174 RepID=A0AAD5VFD9_9AGAR|nr:hypothetical protein NP233_g11976 [Leucocoprinus birnbaumii]